MSKRTLPEAHESRVSMEPDVAIAMIGVFSGAADGTGISTTEVDTLNEMLKNVGLFAHYVQNDFVTLAGKVNQLIEAYPSEDLIIAAIGALPDQECREAAYTTAVAVTATDDYISKEEEDYLDSLQQRLSISDERAFALFRQLFPVSASTLEDDDELTHL